MKQYDKKTALSKWYKRYDEVVSVDVPEGMESVSSKELPQSIKDIDDTILGKALLCENTWRPFRIVNMELDFYRKHNITLPRKHYYVRYQDRLNKRTMWISLHIRKCDNCWKEMLSRYPKNTTFKVYCEECYNKEI